MKDRSMICIQCGNQFILTFNEQEKLLARGFSFPKRCSECRKHKSRTTRDAHEEWYYMRKNKQSRREKNFFEETM
ncbi:zinc-ribbon domain containing protein [Thermodesulfobacteriota bacterium]